MMRDSAYAMIHSTRPQTIGLALADTPIGFAGWVIENAAPGRIVAAMLKASSARMR